MKKFICFFAVMLTAIVLSGAERKPMSLVIMVDGMRVDVPGNLNMINYEMLRKGKWHPDYHAVFADNCRTVPDANPDSAPNHATIITGVSAAKHKVAANGSTRTDKFKVWKPYLARLTESGSIKKGAYCYLWAENDRYPMGKDVSCYRNKIKGLDFLEKDEDCVNRVIASLESDNTPESTLLFVDSLDHSGHRGGRMDFGVRHGFYPYSRNYIYAAARTDWWLGNIFQSLRRRKTFDQENWLIIICADHGGFSSGHGSVAEVMARTTPLLVIKRDIQTGTMAAMPSLMDIAPTVLKHHGMDVAKLDLDGKPLDYTLRADVKRKLADGLIYYLSFDKKVDENLAGTSPVAVKNAIPALVAGRFSKAADFRSNGGFLQLLKSNLPDYENKRDFTVTFWIRSSAVNGSDPVIFSNKNWRNGSNPGAAFIRKAQPVIDKKTKKPRGKEDFYHFNVGSSAQEKVRIDMRKMHHSPGNWIFFGITNRGGQMYMVQGFPDGNFYWMSEDSSKVTLFTDLPWTINQDGTGKYSKRINFQMDDFALWTRTLTLDELKNIFILGRSGASLAAVIKRVDSAQ